MAVKRVTSPLTTQTARSLVVGDMVLVSGTIVTGRDRVHAYLASGGEPPVDLRGKVLYHCGPVAVKSPDGSYMVTAAGPTTSMREEPYEAAVIERFGVAAVMGKGGMGDRTREALRSCGCVYLHATGGAARYLAGCIERVVEVHLEEFGQPEAMWVLAVKDLPALVTMDAHGESLHETVLESSRRAFMTVLQKRYAPQS
ncbi:MAG TPA: FumA C-terminus/TtdB family hydratase beta subunit [Deltaproteobacteria bacterium]|nr:FumA C-terminus/TtdB family hydratase beta subunit [Deltaproteobacteria bacterium]